MVQSGLGTRKSRDMPTTWSCYKSHNSAIISFGSSLYRYHTCYESKTSKALLNQVPSLNMVEYRNTGLLLSVYSVLPTLAVKSHQVKSVLSCNAQFLNSLLCCDQIRSSPKTVFYPTNVGEWCLSPVKGLPVLLPGS